MAVDILLAIKDESGQWIRGEGQTSLADEGSAGDRDSLTSDLQDAPLLELDEFSLGLELHDQDVSDENLNEDRSFLDRVGGALDSVKNSRDGLPGGNLLGNAAKTALSGMTAESLASRLQQNRRKFDKWIRGQDNPVKAVKTGSGASRIGGFPVEFQEFEFTRIMDRASIELFDACCNSLTLQGAVLLKRKDAGVGKPQTYLRVDFNEILVISVDWEVDEMVKETVKFICRSANLKYRGQRNPGVLGPPTSVVWDPPNNLSGG